MHDTYQLISFRKNSVLMLEEPMGPIHSNNLDVAIMQQEINELRARLAQSSINLNVTTPPYYRPSMFPKFLAFITLMGIVVVFAWPAIRHRLPEMPRELKNLPDINQTFRDYQHNMKVLEEERRLRDREFPRAYPVQGSQAEQSSSGRTDTYDSSSLPCP